jgi:hypothetical protein
MNIDTKSRFINLTGTANPSGAHEIIPVFIGVRVTYMYTRLYVL